MNLKSVLFIGAAALTLTACGGGKMSPDEFEVVSRAPLVVPPEADLAPPRPGVPNAQTIDPGQQAYEALFPDEDIKRSKPKSVSERELLSRLAFSDADVRSNAGQKDLAVVKKTLLLAEILEAEERQYSSDNISIERVSSSR
ncbi:MAG: DUF3035 domain-containing protein [Alphaproteobacteria bacterium]|nr:DUF3035 domain-containing protein [Alphaproteobacteria bacterium]